jgi:hypothetical protein
MSRRFPLPWTVHNSKAAFWVEDATGKQFAFCYVKTRPDQPDSDSLLSADEARRLAMNVARLPGLLRGDE